MQSWILVRSLQLGNRAWKLVKLSATIALSLPVIGVRFLVLSKAIAVREGLFANIALEPLPDVVFAVPSQLFLAWKLCITTIARHTLSLLTMSLVFKMAARLPKLLAALATLKCRRALLVNEHVVSKSVGRGKLLAADRTLEGKDSTFTHHLHYKDWHLIYMNQDIQILPRDLSCHQVS